MVTYEQLRSAHPDDFQKAADDLLSIARTAEESSNAIHANGRKKLEESWKDNLGEIVRESLGKSADAFDVIAILNRSAATTLDTRVICE